MSKTALVLVASGSEEMEFVIATDVLSRAGIHVTTAGVPDGSLLQCGKGVRVKPDVGISEVKSNGPFDIIVLPGGLVGSLAFGESTDVGEMLKDQECRGGWIAAICAGPVALAMHQIGYGKNVTCYPKMRRRMEELGKYNYTGERVEVDGNLITSLGPSTSFEFALKIVEKLVGKEKVDELTDILLLNY